MDILKEIRAASSVPVILLTANDMETDIVAGKGTCAAAQTGREAGGNIPVCRFSVLFFRNEIL